MTVSVLSRRVAYSGNGATKTFSIPYQFFELAVYVDGVLKNYGPDYSITQTSTGADGFINFGVAPALGEPVVIIGSTEAIQGVDLVDNDSAPAEVYEGALDRLTMLAQELGAAAGRTLRAPLFAADLPEMDFKANPEALFVTDASGNPKLEPIYGPTSPLTPVLNQAQTYATAAANSASNAATSEENISTSEDNAAASASAANTAALAAASSASSVNLPSSLAGQELKYLRVKADETGYEFAEVEGGGSVATVFGRTGAVVAQAGDYTKADVGLGSVDNTSDATKNTAVATLTNKTLTSPVINNPTGITKANVGLGNVDNTSDATKNAAAVTLTNKTINGSNNTISNLTLAMLAANVADIDGTLAANSDTRVATQKAIRTYVDRSGPSGVNLKSFGAVGDGATNDILAFSNAISYCLTNKRSLFVPAGTYRIIGDVIIDMSSYLSQGFNMVGEGRNVSSIVFDTGYKFAIEAASDWHFGCLAHLRISGNINNTFMRIGKTDYSDPANEFIIDDLFITNGNTGSGAIALQLNYFVNGYVNAVINGGGYNVGTKIGSGFAALDIRQAVFSTFLGSYSLSATGAYLRDGFVYGNTFLNVDTEACTTDWAIVSANAINNTWLGGQISLATTGVQASAGSNNVFINPHVDTASLTGVFNGTTGIWFKTPGYSNVATPTFPSTGVSVTNNKGQSAIVYINGGTITGVTVNGTIVFNQVAPITVILQPGDRITMTYTGTPSWIWLPLY